MHVPRASSSFPNMKTCSARAVPPNTAAEPAKSLTGKQNTNGSAAPQKIVKPLKSVATAGELPRPCLFVSARASIIVA